MTSFDHLTFNHTSGSHPIHPSIYSYDYHCTTSICEIISDLIYFARWVLTAAHCVTQLPDGFVIVIIIIVVIIIIIIIIILMLVYFRYSIAGVRLGEHNIRTEEVQNMMMRIMMMMMIFWHFPII